MLAGVLSFFSPCVLPIVPGYLGYLSGLQPNGATDNAARKRFNLVVSSLFFVTGFISVFMVIGLSSSMLGSFMGQYMLTFQRVAGVMILLLGIHFLGLLQFGWLNRDIRYMPNFRSGGFFTSFIVGLAFGFGWTPCVGPVLATIFLVVATSTEGGLGVGLLLAYGLGIGVPFVVVALFADLFIKKFASMKSFMPVAKVVLGGFMVLTGVAMISGRLNDIGYWLLRNTTLFNTVG